MAKNFCITVDADSASNAKDFIMKHFDIKNLNGVCGCPRDDSDIDMDMIFDFCSDISGYDFLTVTVPKVFSVVQNTDGAIALRELMHMAGFSQSKIKAIFSMLEVEKFGVINC